MDRDTPVARIVHVAKSPGAAKEATWMTEAQRLGLITLPSDPEDFPAYFFDKEKMPVGEKVLAALLEEREEGR